MNAIFLLLSLAQADAAPRAEQVRPERQHQRPEMAAQARGELARKTQKLQRTRKGKGPKKGKKGRRGFERRGPPGAKSFSGQGHAGKARGPQGQGTQG